MKTHVFDIETAPLPESELVDIFPPFDPAEVKTGNIKDPEKVAAKIAESEQRYRRNFIDKAALDPLTGRVLAVGLIYQETGEFKIIGHDDERLILEEFWDVCRGDKGGLNQMVGFNSHQFDLPFLIRRSWRHQVAVPFGIRHRRYWSENMVDLRLVWLLGDRQAKGSLDSIAKHLGVGAKNGDGKDFARLWETDREMAIAYLKNDVELTARVAEVLFEHV